MNRQKSKGICCKQCYLARVEALRCDEELLLQSIPDRIPEGDLQATAKELSVHFLTCHSHST